MGTSSPTNISPITPLPTTTASQPTHSSSSTQSRTKEPTITPTASPITSSPTPISPTTSPTPSNGHHVEFYCGATKAEAELCQYSCLVSECPMNEYCYEITTCS